MRHTLTIVLSMTIHSLFGQEQLTKVDKRVIEIENVKKYKVYKLNDIELKEINKNLIEATDYQGGKNGLHIFEEKLKIDSGLCFRTYYFDKELICIKEKKVLDNKTIVQSTYYFSNKTLFKVVNGNGTDVTSQLNKTELIDRIKQYWGDEIK